MSPITSTPASRASSTLQCGAGCVSGAPGVSTSAEKRDQFSFRKSAVAKPSLAASASLSAPSSPAITSAPPAFKARQLARPEPPRPNTATVLPAKQVTGIKVTPRFLLSCHLPPCGGGRRCEAASGGGCQHARLRDQDTPLPNPPPQGGSERREIPLTD